jgi:hypothetical protein
VISRRELEQLRAEWTLDIGVIEKDYVLGWLLAGIAQDSRELRLTSMSCTSPGPGVSRPSRIAFFRASSTAA